MRSLALLVLTTLASPPSVLAQFPDDRRAFEPAITPWLGLASYGVRLSSGGGKASYSGSVTAGARAEMPLTRRVGLMASASISPLAEQKFESVITSQFVNRAPVYRADVGFGWRFKPRAPVFFYGGGGIVGATKTAYPDYDESALDPNVAFAIGFDRARTGRLSFRAVYASYLVFPSAPSPSSATGNTALDVQAKSAVYDWTLELGGRYALGGRR